MEFTLICITTAIAIYFGSMTSSNGYVMSRQSSCHSLGRSGATCTATVVAMVCLGQCSPKKPILLKAEVYRDSSINPSNDYLETEQLTRPPVYLEIQV